MWQATLNSRKCLKPFVDRSVTQGIQVGSHKPWCMPQTALWIPVTASKQGHCIVPTQELNSHFSSLCDNSETQNFTTGKRTSPRTIKNTFLCGCVLYWQGNKFLIGWQNGPLSLCLFPLHLTVELSSLSPGSELFDCYLFKIKTLC